MVQEVGVTEIQACDLVRRRATAILAGGLVWVVLAAADPSGSAGVPRPLIRTGPLTRTTVTSALFRFVDVHRGLRFECSLDKAAFVSCESPTRYG